MPETVIAGSDDRLRWEGAVSVQRTEDWTRAWRLPYERLDLFPGGELRARAAMPAGVRLAFGVNAAASGRLIGRAVPEQAQPGPPPPEQPQSAGAVQVQPAERPRLDIVLVAHAPADGGAPAASPEPVTVELAPDGSFGVDIPAGESALEIWLPPSSDFRLRDLTLPDGARLVPYRPAQQPRWLAYGSSITQCRSAPTPTRTWPALVARSLGLDLTCLGFAGECHLDQMVARTIADRPADLVTACLGINVYGNGSFNRRSFLPAVLGFVATIRDGHPDVPVVLISPIVSPEREQTPGPAGMPLQEIRDQLSEAQQLLRQHGDNNLHLVQGPELLGPAQARLLGDGLHPTGDGYAAMAEAIAPRLRGLLAG